MNTPAQTQAICDAAFAIFSATITASQVTWLANNGRYWQLLATHSAGNVPADGVANPADNLGAYPSYQPGKSFGVVLATAIWSSTYALSIDQYYRPDPYVGFTATLWVVCQGVLYSRTQNMAGPETWRSTPWAPATGYPLAGVVT